MLERSSSTEHGVGNQLGMSFRSVVVAALLFVAWLLNAPEALAASIDRQTQVPAVRATAPLPLDATLSDPQWQNGAMAGEFFNFTTRQPAHLKTVVYILYDDTNLYVAFHCEQQGTPIIATQTTNNIGQGLDDEVGVGLDPGGNGSRVYMFQTTPKGIQYPYSSESNLYNPAWQTAAKVDGT